MEVQQVHQDIAEPKETQDPLEQMVPQAIKAQKVQMALQGAKDAEGLLDQQVTRVHQVALVIQVLKATRVVMGSLGYRGRKETLS